MGASSRFATPLRRRLIGRLLYHRFVLTLSGDRICAMTHFGNDSVLPWLGLPRSLPG
jgi:hypothetical protein